MRVVLLTGTVGVGKSTIGFAVAERAAALGVASAFLDLDQLSRLWPAPDDDPFRTELLLANLASVVSNYADAGARVLVLAWVIAERRDLDALEAAVGSPPEVVRLVAPAAVVAARLRTRHQGAEADGLAWHLRRAPELLAIQDQNLHAITIDASDSVASVADAVLAQIEPVRRRRREQMRADSTAATADPDDRSEARRVSEEMDDLRAW